MLVNQLHKHVLAADQDYHDQIITADSNNGVPTVIMIGSAVHSSSTCTTKQSVLSSVPPIEARVWVYEFG